MKHLFAFFSIIMISFTAEAQEQKVEIVPDSLFITSDKTETQEAFLLSCSAPGVVIQCFSHDYYLPFKLYDFTSKNENWLNPQSVYNTIQAKVPNVSITTSTDLNAIPKISMRGDDNTIVIVDGIRYDASILNTLNPSNIESITVAPGVTASNYLRNEF